MRPFYLFVILMTIIQIGCRPNPEVSKPNIVLILADDLGYGDLGSYGCTDIQTPHVDRLAEQGVRLTQFYANAPECTPTRAALLSGRYQQRIGGLECAIGAGNVGRYDDAIQLSDQHELGLPPAYTVLPRTLAENGYKTAIIGKWHLGYETKFRPDRQGFDYSIGPLGYGGDYFYHVEQDPIRQADFSGAHNLAENGKELFRDGEYMTRIITDKAVEWLNLRDMEEPFFLYLPYTAPHSPYQGPGDDIGRPIEGDEWKEASREKYIEMVEAMDRGIGRVLGTLSEKGLDEETLVIFFSDNGGTRQASNGILSGYKGHVWEGGIRVPCIVKWPDNIEPNTVSHQVSIGFDLTCSLLKLSGADTRSMSLDGFDIVNHLVKKDPDVARTLYWRNRRGNVTKKAVRDGDLKYLIELRNDTTFLEGMYNLEDDPSETEDLLLSDPDKAFNMKRLLYEWEENVKVSS